MIDTHTHIYLKQFNEDRASMLERAKNAGVAEFYLPNIDKHSIADLKELAAQHPNIYPMMGLHPSHVKEDYKEHLAVVFEELNGDTQYHAVGEIGIDLYWDKTFIAEQKKAFGIQIEKAKEMGLPVVIHSRNAFDETFEVLEAFADDRLFGIFHCFTGNLEQAQHAISLNLKLGIGGVVTFKNGGLDKVVEKIGLENLVLETDAPYLAPAPHRGKRNEPAYLALVAKKIADLHKVPLSEVDRLTTQNAQQVFNR
jgi:TatD DNase family protein